MRFDPFARMARRKARREAARWFARRSDPAARESDRAGFERWLAEDPEHLNAWREADRTWALAREAARHPNVSVVADPVPAWRGASRGWWFARGPLLAGLASLLLLLGLIGPLVFHWYEDAGSATVYATQTGAQRNVVLRDGTTLLLDTDSAVVVRFGRHARRVEVRRGRVEFRVRHDPALPFIVRAGAGTITDVGTTFQASVSGGAVQVVLIEGKVSVAAARSSATLRPGQALEFDRTGIVQPAHPADIAAALGWTHGELIARDWPLARLLADMNRYSDLKVDIADPSLRDIRATGSFRVGDQDTLVRILQAGWPIRAERVSAQKILLFHD